MTQTLVDILLHEARDGLKLQNSSGSMPAGRNGSYGDPETPLRCTAHALVSFSRAYQLTGSADFKVGADAALNYLLLALSQSTGGIIMRHAKGKDYSNGVLGPAFLIEALHSAWEIFQRADAKDAALAILFRHQFDETALCWRRVTPAGESIPPDYTFNHQLYFAAVAALFRHESQEAERVLLRFLDGWSKTLQVREDGRIVHGIATDSVSVRQRLSRLFRGGDKINLSALKKEADYHLYNCYAFSLLAESGLDVRAAAGDKWKGITKFATSETVLKSLAPSTWSLPLRSGTETRVLDYMYFQNTFGGSSLPDETAVKFLEHILGPDRSGSIYSPDPVTQKARTYRYWRLIK